MWFFFNDTATTEIYTLSLHDALPIYARPIDDPAEDVAPQLVGAEVVLAARPGLPERVEVLLVRVVRREGRAEERYQQPEAEIGRAHVGTPVTPISRMPSSA